VLSNIVSDLKKSSRESPARSRFAWFCWSSAKAGQSFSLSPSCIFRCVVDLCPWQQVRLGFWSVIPWSKSGSFWCAALLSDLGTAQFIFSFPLRDLLSGFGATCSICCSYFIPVQLARSTRSTACSVPALGHRLICSCCSSSSFSCGLPLVD
jgi:hypothetical protein